MSAYCPHSVGVTGQFRHSHLWHLTVTNKRRWCHNSLIQTCHILYIIWHNHVLIKYTWWFTNVIDKLILLLLAILIFNSIKVFHLCKANFCWIREWQTLHLFREETWTNSSFLQQTVCASVPVSTCHQVFVFTSSPCLRTLSVDLGPRPQATYNWGVSSLAKSAICQKQFE